MHVDCNRRHIHCGGLLYGRGRLGGLTGLTLLTFASPGYWVAARASRPPRPPGPLPRGDRRDAAANAASAAADCTRSDGAGNANGAGAAANGAEEGRGGRGREGPRLRRRPGGHARGHLLHHQRTDRLRHPNPPGDELFKATEGRTPKSHEEFMEKIIKANHIHLPTLPEGHRYVYDPKQEQLMVEQPAQ